MRTARSRRGGMVVAIAAVIVAIGALINASARLDTISKFSVVDDRKIAVTVTTGDFTWTRVSDLTETATDVRVEVKSFEIPFVPKSLIGRELTLTVVLQAPLGTRIVLDGTGQIVPSAP